MTKFFTVLVLLLGTASTAMAQGLTVRPYVGTYAPMLPMASLGTEASDVELESAAAAGLEIGYGITGDIAAYGGITGVFSRMNHSTAMEFEVVDNPASSRVNVLIPTLGVTYAVPVGELGLRPTVRLGLGAKIYDTDLYYVEETIMDFAGDVGLGVVAGNGPVVFSAEARWLPSSFNPENLPIRMSSADGQLQNDWLFQIGFALQP